jgi:hydroxyacylglutathione hydrolase
MSTRMIARIALILLVMPWLFGGIGATSASAPVALRTDSPFNVTWIHGSADCSTNTDTPIQVYRFDSDTYILRENKCWDFEAPFLYLFIGNSKALLVDTGAQPPKGKTFPVHDTVQRILAAWEASHHGSSVDLIVAHSHSHGDHKNGDSQFEGQAHTFVVKPDLDAIKSYFKLPEWPEGSAKVDLGGRVITVMPAPGHEQTHMAYYDSKTHVLLTGDMLYPGLLTVDDWPAYRASVRRLSDFVSSHPVSYVLGAHIEMTSTPKKMYPMMTTFQPEEHVLQMTVADLEELQKACDALGDNPVRDVHDNFIICPYCNGRRVPSTKPAPK